MRWLFVPYKSLDYEKSTAAVVGYYKSKYNPFFSLSPNGLKVVWKREAGETLKDVKDNHMVLIPGHGNHRTEKHDKIGVQASQDPENKEMVNANELAGMLAERGLPSTHVYIKTLSCCGGGLFASKGMGDTNTKDHLVDECYASVLAKALAIHEKKYTRVIVGGYLGYVIFNQSTTKTLLIQSLSEESHTLSAKEKELLNAEKGFRVSAKKLRPVWYNGQGARVDGPVRSKSKDIVL